MKPKVIILLILVLILSVIFYFRDTGPILRINNQSISLIIADTVEEREKGLGDRESMSDDTAMLFVFEQPDIYEFWMKDMKFPLDIVWLNENREVIHIKENAQPDSYPESFVPPQKALYVIELNAGLVFKYDIKVGNILNFKF